MENQKYSARELAEQFGCDVRTIQRIGNSLFGKGANGVRREFDGVQATAILEKIKIGNPNQHDTPTAAAQVETLYSSALKRAEILNAARTLPLEEKLKTALMLQADVLKDMSGEVIRLKAENYDLHDWLRVRNEQLISSGLALNDQEDISALYRRFR
ncbi:hypothetical protein FACS1894151_10670 [Spirochaetia bacterium]|nr:hypothetical protein FACS1894151_10670 [Spirochaetia bacterium]